MTSSFVKISVNRSLWTFNSVLLKLKIQQRKPSKIKHNHEILIQYSLKSKNFTKHGEYQLKETKLIPAHLFLEPLQRTFFCLKCPVQKNTLFFIVYKHLLWNALYICLWSLHLYDDSFDILSSSYSPQNIQP